MTLLIDMMVGIGAILAAGYCMVLSRRLRALTRLDGDVGRAIAVLSAQVDELSRILQAAEQSSGQAGQALQHQIAQAEGAARKLELLMAAGQQSPQNGAVSAVAPRTEPVSGHRADNFAPFGRSETRIGTETRSRVLRQRDLGGAVR